MAAALLHWATGCLLLQKMLQSSSSRKDGLPWFAITLETRLHQVLLIKIAHPL